MHSRVTELHTIEALEKLAPEWDALHARVSPRLPFTSAHWNILWWRHFAQQRASVRDELHAFSVRDAHGRLIAVAPMMITQRPGVGPLRVRKLQFLGTDANITELRRLLCLPEHEAPVIEALLAHIDASSSWDFCEWSGLAVPTSGPHALAHQPRFVPSDERIDFYLQLAGTWESFKSSRSRNIKESLRKCYNSLKRDGLVPSLRVIEEPAAVLPALERFFALHKRRAALTNTIEHRDVFETELARSFLRAFLDHAARNGEARLFQLEVNGNVVATRLAFAYGDELYLYFSGYEPDYGKYSVMTTLVAEVLRWSFDHNIRIVNLSPGVDVSKTRWSPDEARFLSGSIRSCRVRGRLAESAYSNVVQRASQSALLGRVANYVKRAR